MPYALVTGASKGIGKALAFELAKRNYDILITARSGQLLSQVADVIKSLYSVQVNFLALDLSEISAAQKLYKWCIENNYDVSILVNNAGFGLSGDLNNSSLEKTTDLLQLNIIAPTQLCHLFIPLLRNHNKSFIMNIASTAAYQSVPFLNVYSASKTYIKNFSRGLSRELENSNISVTCISPGPTDTDWASTAAVPNKVLKMADNLNMQAKDVARTAVGAMFKKRKEYVPGVLNKLGVFTSWLLPKSIVEKSITKLYK